MNTKRAEGELRLKESGQDICTKREKDVKKKKKFQKFPDYSKTTRPNIDEGGPGPTNRVQRKDKLLFSSVFFSQMRDHIDFIPLVRMYQKY